METIKSITDWLELQFPLSSQASFDNCGMLVGDKSWEIKGILVCLDSTEDIIDEAIEQGANLVIAHHPLIFKGLKKITGSNYIERTLIKAIKNDIAIYALHTNLDHSLKGVNAEIAKRLDMRNTKILQPLSNTLSKLCVFVPRDHVFTVEQALFKAGAGKIGNYGECSFESEGIGSFTPLEGSNPTSGSLGMRSKEQEVKVEVLVSNHHLSAVLHAMHLAHPYEEVAHDIIPLSNSNQDEGSGMIGDLEFPVDAITFLAKLKQVFHCGSIRHTELPAKPIKRVAVCGGSGSFLLKDAIRNKADIFVTADFKYHEFFDADNQIVIADIGHYESEQFTINLIVSILTEKFTKFAVLKTRGNTNPINYF